MAKSQAGIQFSKTYAASGNSSKETRLRLPLFRSPKQQRKLSVLPQDVQFSSYNPRGGLIAGKVRARPKLTPWWPCVRS